MIKLKTGFTLVETMVVLLISALILGLSLWMVNGLNLDHLRDAFFWRRFQSQFDLCENTARRHHSPTTVVFRPHNQVTFINDRLRSPNLELPRTLSPAKTYTVMIRANGHVNPQSLIWLVNGRPRLIQKFQLGWGMYNLVAKK